MPPFSRRDFLHSSLGLAAGVAATGVFARAEEAKAEEKQAEANDRINVAVIGLNGRGGSHISDLIEMGDIVNLYAVCDADANVLAAKAKAIEEATGTAPKTYQDIRKLLEDKELDAVTIATPNHWHSLASIWAIQAGKDVYVEKPLSHNVHEGRILADFAKQHKKIVVHGTQSRSMPGMVSAMRFLHEGGLGKVFLARGTCYKNRGSIGDTQGEQPIPAGVDYDLWCGPAPKKPLMRKKLHYDWHWTWDYGNGDIGNQGVHQMDICLWGLNKRELPTRVQCVGGRFGYIDDGETPNTQVATLDFGDAQAIFEVRGLNSKPVPGAKEGVGNVFYGTEGTLVVDGYSPVLYRPNGEKAEIPAHKSDVGGNHMVTFIKAIHSRQLDPERGDAEIGHVSSACCHLANISYRLGAKAPFSSKSKAFGDDKAAYASLERMEKHLAENGLKLEETDYMVGIPLEFDPKTERFKDNQAANAMLTREPREPFVVPGKVV